jgi:hypothetical protein
VFCFVGVLSVHDRFTEKLFAYFDRALRFLDQFSVISTEEAQGRLAPLAVAHEFGDSGAEVHVTSPLFAREPVPPIKSVIRGFRLGHFGRHDGADAALY